MALIPESFANSFATNVYGAGLSAHQGALMAQYQMDEYTRRQMSARQQAMMEMEIKRELEQQICEQVKKNIKMEKRKDMATYGTNYTATWNCGTTTDATDYAWYRVYGEPLYYQSQATAKFPESSSKPEPKPKKIAKKALSFYEDLKAEIEGWLKGVLDFAY